MDCLLRDYGIANKPPNYLKNQKSYIKSLQSDVKYIHWESEKDNLYVVKLNEFFDLIDNKDCLLILLLCTQNSDFSKLVNNVAI